MADGQTLSGKVALVSGAARGIGRSSAMALARAGATIVGADIAGPVDTSLEVAPATAAELEETGRQVSALGVSNSNWLFGCISLTV